MVPTVMPCEIAVRVLAYLDDADFCAARLAHRWFVVHTNDEITKQRRLAVWSRRDLDLCREGNTTAVAALAAAGHYFNRHHLGEAAAHGHVNLVDLLLSDAVPHTRCSHHVMNRAAEAGQLDVVIYLHRAVVGKSLLRVAGGFTYPAAMDYAAGGGHLDVVRWLHENSPLGCTTEAMDMAAAGGHVEVLRWLHEHRTDGCTADAGSTSCGGNVEAVQWLFDHLPQQFLYAKRVFRDAASHGHIGVLRWLCTSGSVSRYSTSMAESAAKHGHLDVLQWMAAHMSDARFEASITQAAARRGHLHVVEWLCDNYPDARPTPPVLTAALTGGHMDVVAYLCAREPGLGVLDDAVDAVVNRGCYQAVGPTAPRDCFDALEWLRANRPEVVPLADTMDVAAFTGKLAVAQWLHAHYAVRCSARAIDAAAAAGRLDLIEWLWVTYGHPCTTEALHYATAQGHVAILGWLRDRFPHLAPTTADLDIAASRGHLAVLQWLHRNHPAVRASEFTLAVAAAGGDLSVVRFLREAYALEVTEALIAAADRHEHFAIVDYLRSVSVEPLECP
ncbi:Ankyrin repeat domain containing protein [Pandoravirus dulcis]|uniref:Ankyrin repeat domain containing protein n=1 Tax=Pandoravirus dulcis TaxID=1349409 RepID=S4VUD8_9VIRU|nr:Ankyrin repeat domain containing protein [Pandoravirus dulcis]AGO83005.1 Ankyrin repeat domain containing protein [Pandoravirus dulcis]